MTDAFYYLLTKGMLKQEPTQLTTGTSARIFELNVIDNTNSIVGTTVSKSFDVTQDGKGITMGTSPVTIENILEGKTITKIRWSYSGVTLHEETIPTFTYNFLGDYIITQFDVPLSNADNGLLYAMAKGLLLETTTAPSTISDNKDDKILEILNASNVVVGNQVTNVSVTFPPNGKGLWLDTSVRVEGFTNGDVASKVRLSSPLGNPIQVLTLINSATYTNTGSYTVENTPIELDV